MPLPVEVVRLTDQFLGCVDDGSPGLVTDLYLHGSLCWGEFFDGSDLDFVAVLGRTPDVEALAALARAHERVREEFPERRFEGFHCRRSDLEGPPHAVARVPVHYQGTFDPDGDLDVNPVTWHELAERGLVVRGALPGGAHGPRSPARVHQGQPGHLLAVHPGADRHRDRRARALCRGR